VPPLHLNFKIQIQNAYELKDLKEKFREGLRVNWG
jgi:hypothetical protein